MNRAATRCSSGGRSSHAGTHGGRGAISVPGGQQARLELAGEGLVPPPVPALVEPAAVALDPLGRGVVGRVAGPGAEVEEEPAVHVDGPQVGQLGDGLVGQVGAQVVALLDRPRRLDRVVVVVEGGDELVGLAAVEPVPAVEAPGQGPAVARARPCWSRRRG